MTHLPDESDQPEANSGKTSTHGSTWAMALGAVVVVGTAQSAFADDVTVSRVGRNVIVSGGDGNDSVTIQPGAEAGQIRVVGFDGTTVNGGSDSVIAIGKQDTLVVDLGDGLNLAEVTGALPTFRTFRGIGGGTSANSNNRFSFSNATLPGATRLETRGGGLVPTLVSSTFTRGALIAGGDGVDSIYCDGCTFPKGLTLRFGGVAQNGAYINNAVMNGSLKVFGGAGDDEIFCAGGTYGKKVLMDGGAGNDTMQLDRATFGAVKVRMGDGIDVGQVFGSTVRSKLKIDLGEGDDNLAVILTDTRKGAKLVLGGGNDFGSLGDLNNSGKLVLLAGDGNDTFAFRDTVGSQTSRDILIDGGSGGNSFQNGPSLSGGGKLVLKNFPI